MSNIASIVLGGGCFWCTEAVYKRVLGVVEVTPGYAGGETPNPTYEDVLTGRTGHAEVIKVDFDSNTVSLEEILNVFFAAHDPTTPNRQGADVGTQYRSIILYTSEDQKEVIERIVKEKQNDFSNKIVTEIKPLEKFYKAEEYHMEYYENNKSNTYCKVVISPKLKELTEKGIVS